MGDLLVAEGLARVFDDPSGPIHALRPTDLAIGDQDWLTIMGPSGSGKSTLLSLLGLLDEPTSGLYTVAGTRTDELGERRRTGLRARLFGFVFQSFHLPAHRTTLDSVLMGSLYLGGTRRARVQEATEMLARVGLEQRANTETRLLSGGQRQRVAIARALVGSPRVILCDEPTGNLDSRSAESLLDLLADLQTAGVAIVIVTHDPQVAGHGSRKLEIMDGRCREC